MEKRQTVGIFTAGYRPACINAWDPDSIQKGIPGSEESVIYLSQALADLDNEVTVFGDPPENSPHSKPGANPRYVFADELSKETLDIAIAWNISDQGPRLKKRAKKVYCWPHGICTFQLSQEQIDAFDDVFWLSHWQRKQWTSIYPSMERFKNIYGNGINPEQFEPVTERRNPYSCIYASNYSRGLEVLLDIWPAMRHLFPEATLDIYYGWQHFGDLAPQTEEKLRTLIPKMGFLGVQEHGQVGHAALNRAFSNASLWTYPCIMAETFCITALRAQMAGAVPVVRCGTALYETVRHGYLCQELNDYPALLYKALSEAPRLLLGERQKMGRFIFDHYTWKNLAERWNRLFTQKD